MKPAKNNWKSFVKRQGFRLFFIGFFLSMAVGAFIINDISTFCVLLMASVFIAYQIMMMELMKSKEALVKDQDTYIKLLEQRLSSHMEIVSKDAGAFLGKREEPGSDSISNPKIHLN